MGHINRPPAPSVLFRFGQWEARVETGEDKDIRVPVPLGPSQPPLKLPVFLMAHCSFQHTISDKILLPGSLPSSFGPRVSNGSAAALSKFLC